ncbi:OsmC family protein [Shewanella yunxiaonensis]|uniref:OsmC family protein n=1 Tax=Shewanella yunxiaonensis TaxID=2829809 RepID=A0ABX7YQ00_9GAMM|nr:MULTISPECIES: OsmC family protein [Shewanella]MDF0534788.1 OsmC family protein [Shewanella sp. A32]QUN04812.1 OsmC family protein [Shewanella yunxiaonensis]
MSFHVTVSWETSPAPEGEFVRDHQIQYGSGQRIEASAAAEYKGNETKVNPEESLLAAISSCHMLTFLTIAHLKRLPVLTYCDKPVAELGKKESGKIAITHIFLRPQVTFAEGADVDRETLEKIHEKAHANCFIANSLASDTKVEIEF